MSKVLPCRTDDYYYLPRRDSAAPPPRVFALDEPRRMDGRAREGPGELNPENLNRIRTRELVALLPGIHLRELQRILKTSFTTTRYHVDNLQRDGLIVRFEEGKQSRLYPVGIEEDEKKAYAVLHQAPARRILRALAESEAGLTNEAISKTVRIPRSSVSEYIELLREAKLVRRSVSIGGRVQYDLQDRGAVVPLLALFERNLLSVATESFIDLWEI
jgi:DNA-binding Lrp family transcriptional regulator